MVSWYWLPITAVATFIVILVVAACIAGGQADDRIEQGAAIDSLRAENATLRLQLEETTALQLKLAAEKAMGGKY